MILFSVIAGLLLSIYFFIRLCDKANSVDWGSRKVNLIVGFIKLFCRYVHKFQFDEIPLPADGSALVASNHISGLDPFLLIAASPRPLRFLIAREEYERFGVNWLFRLARCIPVDRQGRPDLALREALTMLEQNEVVAIFPQGKIHLDSDPPRKLRGGVVMLAQKVECDIYPVRIDDVRGAGLTALAILIPSVSKLTPFPPLDCKGLEQGDCLNRLASTLGLKTYQEGLPTKQENKK